MSGMHRRLVTLAAVLTLGAGGLTLATAAVPSAGTVSPSAPTYTWEGKSFVVGGATGGAADPAAACPPARLDPTNAVCDRETVTVAVPASFYDTRAGALVVRIDWPDVADDFDLYVFDGRGAVVGSSTSGNQKFEEVAVDKASGVYEVLVAPATVTNSGYAGRATFLDKGPVADPPPVVSSVYNAARVTGPNPEAEPRGTALAVKGEQLDFRVTDVGREAAEPTVAVTKKGATFFPAATFDALPKGSPRQLARTELLRSTDAGRTFTSVLSNNAGAGTPSSAPASPVTLDPYVYVDETTDRVFNVDLLVAGSFLSVSDDQGATFSPGVALNTGEAQDHQTLTTGRKPAAFPLSPVGYPNIVYYCYNAVAESTCLRSLDGGRTFERTGAPAFLGVDPEAGGTPTPAAPLADVCGGLHGHIVTDRDGRLFLPKGHCGKPWIAVSEDAGTTWKRVKVSDTISMLDNQSSVEVDSAGNLYYVWYDGKHKLPYLSTSTDHGSTWSTPLEIAPPGVHEVNWPTIDAGAPGRIAVTFPGTTATDATDPTRTWDTYVVASRDALSANPTFTSKVVNTPGDPQHRGMCDGRCGNMLDFLDILIAPDAAGTIVGTAVDTCTAKDLCNSKRAAGFDGTNDGVASDARGIVFTQLPVAAAPAGSAAGPTVPPRAAPASVPPSRGSTGTSTRNRAPRESTAPVRRIPVAQPTRTLAFTGPALPAGLALLALGAGLLLVRVRRRA